MKNIIFFSFLFIAFISCKQEINKKEDNFKQYITVLGIAQDGGYPHIGCQKECCANYYNGKNKRKSVVSLGLIDSQQKQKWLF